MSRILHSGHTSPSDLCHLMTARMCTFTCVQVSTDQFSDIVTPFGFNILNLRLPKVRVSVWCMLLAARVQKFVQSFGYHPNFSRLLCKTGFPKTLSSEPKYNQVQFVKGHNSDQYICKTYFISAGYIDIESIHLERIFLSIMTNIGHLGGSKNKKVVRNTCNCP